MKSYVARKEDVTRDWVIIDAEGKALGRMAVEIANILRGRTKPTFTPHVDTGDFVVVTNAAKVKLSGKKDEQKTYQQYSGYRSGLKEIPVATMRERHPDQIIRLAVKGMLPKNNLARNMLRRLKVYEGPEHPHEAQKPQATES